MDWDEEIDESIYTEEATLTTTALEEMDQEPELPPFLLLPDKVLKNHLLPKLALADLKKLRLLCSKTKEWVEQYTNFYDNLLVKIHSFENFSKLIVPKKCSNFYVIPKETQEFERFLRRFGCQVKHLKLKYIRGVKQLNSLVEYEYVCPKLTSLDLIGEWYMGEFDLSSTISPSRPFLRKITNLWIHADIEIGYSANPKNLEEVFKRLTSLETFRWKVDARMSFHYKQLFLCMFLSYLRLRCTKHHFAYDSNHAFVSAFSPVANMIEFDWRGIEDIKFNTVEDICCQITALDLIPHSRTVRTVALPFDKFVKITDLSIELSYYDFSEWLANGRRDGVEPPFQHLKKLHLRLTRDCHQSNIDTAATAFGFRGNNVQILKVEVVKILGRLPRIQNFDTSILELLQRFQKVKDLSLGEYFSLGWVTLLENTLERLEIKDVERFRNEDFIGEGDEDFNNPVFCRLINLRHFSIIPSRDLRAPEGDWLSDDVFAKVLKNMKLQSLDIQHPFARSGLEHLAGGALAETVESFPYPWRPQDVSVSRCALRRRDEPPPPPPPPFTSTQFEEFRQRHFKFFKQDQ